MFDEMSEPSASGAMFWDDMLDSSCGGGLSKEIMMVDPSDGGVREDLQDLATNSFLEGDSSVNNQLLNGRDSSFDASTPGIPGQPSPLVGDVSQPCNPPNSCTELSNIYAGGILTSVETQLKLFAEVSILEPPPNSTGNWKLATYTVLPHDILKKVVRKKGEGKYFDSGQKYKPCTWEKFIERVNKKVSAGTLKVTAERPARRRRRQVEDLQEVTDPVVVALQAQAEIYEEHFSAATFWKWD